MAPKRMRKVAKQTLVPRPLAGPPPTMLMRLRYIEDTYVTCTSGVLSQGTWRINDLYDINYSGAGHQSYLRDQMFGIYKVGRVLSATIKVTFISASATANIPSHICLAPTRQVTAFADIQTATETPGGVSAYLNSNSTRTLTFSSTADQYFGASKNTILHDTAYAQGASGTLALSNSMFVAHFLKTLDGSSATVYLKAEVDQIVRWEDPAQQASS